MGHVPRCLIQDLSAEDIQLDTDRRHHLERVLRLRPGDPVELVDGAGGLAAGSYRGHGQVQVSSRQPVAAPAAAGVTLAVAIPRKPRLAWLVEKAAELDVVSIALLITEHGERSVGAGTLCKLARKADETLLQCRRLFSMTIARPRILGDVLDAHDDHQIWLATPHRDTDRGPSRDGRPLLILVGPEGGWSEPEFSQMQSRGAQPVTLGSTVLRVETAALALAAVAALG